MKSQELLNQVEALLINAETLEEIKDSIKLIGKVTLALVLLVTAFIYFVISIFNKEVVQEVTTVVEKVEEVEEVKEEKSDEQWANGFEVDAPELGLAYWDEETEELYHVEQCEQTGKFGIFFAGEWCYLNQGYCEELEEIHDFVALPDSRLMIVLPVETIMRTVCAERYYSSAAH